MSKQHRGPDFERAKQSVLMLLQSIGESVDREGLQDTPRRMADAYHELTWGLRTPWELFRDSVSTTFASRYDEMVVVTGMPFTSLCEHHMLPFMGTATIGYIPGPQGKVIGLSKLPRILQYWAARPQIQEQLTKQVADAVVELISPLGLGVYIEAQHTCMSLRGVKVTGSVTKTSDIRGALREKPEARAEFFQLLR